MTDSDKNNHSIDYDKKSSSLLLGVFVVALVLLLGWYFLAPLFGIVVGLTAGALGIIIATLVIVCLAILLFHIFAGLAALVLGLIVFIWCVIAIALFPIVFPVLIPLLIIMAFVAMLRRRNK